MAVDEQKLKQQYLSRAGERSANERTFLSWMRSAIALMAFAVLIVRFCTVQIPIKHLGDTGWKLGLVFSMVGLTTVLISTKKYFIVRRQIDENTYEPSDWLILFFSVAVGLLGVGVIFFIFVASVNSRSFVIPN
ncbi:MULTISPECIES: YidH family protein [unclassified Microcoleus]|uniref:YidH family protein n=1 Tax=unclassified Microcoleus TaxID=2642155 RepID=UPI002FD63BDC